MQTVAAYVAAGATFALLADFEGEDEGLILREAVVLPDGVRGWYPCHFLGQCVGWLWWPQRAGGRMMAHSPACRDTQARERQRQETWVSRYPTYCRQCDGWGAFHPPGSWEEPPCIDPCDGCTANEPTPLCGRCGFAGLDRETGEGPCSACGWNYDDGLPQYSECDCWLGVEAHEL